MNSYVDNSSGKISCFFYDPSIKSIECYCLAFFFFFFFDKSPFSSMLSQCFGIFGSLLGQLKLDLAWSYRVQICCHSGMFFQIPGSMFAR